jgi:DHA1 family multidrug resistance protein-like MFS transporter
MQQANRRNLIFISFSQFGAAFSFNFVNIFLPFYIIKISPHSFQETLLWVGAIVGLPSLCTAIASPFWGSLTHRISPKALYLRGLRAHSVTFLLMGFTTDLDMLLLLRIIQGFVGGISTIGLIIVSSSSLRERVSLDLGIYQSSMTLGQLVGPPLGSLAAVALGFKGGFVSASIVLFASFIFCHLYVTDVARLPKEEKARTGSAINKRVLVAWGLSFTAQIQLMFLPSVLPKVFEGFDIEPTVALKLAGTVVMFYTATAMVGTYLWGWLSRRIGLHKMITILFVVGMIFQSLLALTTGVVDFTVTRMVQTGMIAATFPLIISLFVREPKGSVIGLLNSARFAGNAMGPIIATTILAYSNLPVLYLFISAITLLAFIAFKTLYETEKIEKV